MFPWFFMFSVTLCGCLHTWRGSYLFQTWWTDLGKERHSPVSGSMLEHIVTPVLVIQGTKRRDMWQHQVGEKWDRRISIQFRPLRSTATTVWFMASISSCLQWLQGFLCSSAATPGPVARNQSRQQWWLKLVISTHCGGHGCQCALLWLHSLPLGIHTDGGCQAGGMQLIGLALVCAWHWRVSCGGCRLTSSTSTTAEA